MASMGKESWMRIAVGVALVAVLVWSGLFIRAQLTTSRVEEILGILAEDKGEITPAIEKELRDLGDRAAGVLAERLGEGRFGAGGLRAAFLAVGAPAAGALAEAIDHEKQPVRLFAAKVLGEIKGNRKDVARALTGALDDKSPDVRAAAAVSLGKIRVESDDVAKALLARLDDTHPAVRQAAVEAIGNVARPHGEVVQALVTSLDDQDGKVRQAAVEALAALGTPDQVIPALAKRLGDDSETPAVRLACIYAFRDIAPHGEAAVPALRKAVTGTDRDMVREAASVLGKYETARDRTTAALIPALTHTYSDVRTAAAESLANFGEEGRAATAALITCLADTQWSVRKAAATALGKVAAPTSPAPAALVKTLSDTDTQVRQAAVLALMDLDMPDPAIAPIITLLDNDAEDLHLRWACAHALARTAQRGRPAIPALTKAANPPDPRLSKQAAESLHAIRNPDE